MVNLNSSVLILTSLLSATSGSLAGEMRIWRDATGKHSVQAEFVSSDDNGVSLRRPDGKVVRVPSAKLSRDDNEFISDAMRHKGADGVTNVGAKTVGLAQPNGSQGSAAVNSEIAELRAQNAMMRAELQQLQTQLKTFEASRQPTGLPTVNWSAPASAAGRPAALPVAAAPAPPRQPPGPDADGLRDAARIIAAGIKDAGSDGSANRSLEKENDRFAKQVEIIRREQGQIDAEGTELNRRLGKVYAEGRQISTEGASISQQISQQSQFGRNFEDQLAIARQNGDWDIVRSSQNELQSINSRLADLRKTYASLSARYAALDSEARSLQGQVEAKRQQFESLNGELDQLTAGAQGIGP